MCILSFICKKVETNASDLFKNRFKCVRTLLVSYQPDQHMKSS